MRFIGTLLISLVSFTVMADEIKRIPMSDHEALAKEGIIVISEEHVRSSRITNVPPVMIDIIKKSPKKSSNKTNNPQKNVADDSN